TMGVYGLWPFLEKKGYRPQVLYQRPLSTKLDSSKLRVDVLGSFFPTIRYAYSTHSLELAHSIVEREIAKLGEKKQLVLYLDGPSATEKEKTAQYREGRRNKSLVRAQEAIDTLQTRISGNLRVRKRHFTAVNKNLRNAFYWCLEVRKAFAEYLVLGGWE
ncbi:hypothetical protein BGX20_007408, partial [Mortierella sp. AD010]